MKFKILFILNILVFALIPTLLYATNGKLGNLKQANTVPKEAQIVTIGFLPILVHELNITSNTYYLDTYLWMKWKGDINPVESMEFINAVDKYDFVKEVLLKEPSELSDGSKYQIMHVEGHFFQNFILSDFPFDKQKLSILIEDSTHGYQKVSYVIDQQASGIGDQLEIPGWNIKNWTASSLIHDYGTSFGENDNLSGGSTYSVARFEINIDRPSSYFIWKLLVPLIIVISGSWMSLLLDSSHLEARTGMPATALLTTVFLQQGYSDNLPQIGYLVLMDKIYVLTYILIVISLIRAISTAYFNNDPNDIAQVTKVKKR